MDPAEVPASSLDAPPALLEVVLRPAGLHVRLGAPAGEDLLVALARGADGAWEDVDVLPAGSAEEVLEVAAEAGDRVRLASEDGSRVSGTAAVVDPDAEPAVAEPDAVPVPEVPQDSTAPEVPQEAGTAEQPRALDEQPAAGAPEVAEPEVAEPEVAEPEVDEPEVDEAVWQLASALEERHPEWSAHPQGPVLHVHGRFGNTFRVAAEALSAGAGEVRAVCAISARGDFTLLVAQGRELLRADERAGVPTQWRHYDLPAHIDAAALAQNPDAERRCRRVQRLLPGQPPEGALTVLREAGVDVSAALDRCTA
ncbi:hypothetical protein [Kineococcus indalonis]|uniref:hypothetical protein n=1 Tax=Kineococcus indalonis TaxID=2696566 RepID=UPI001412F1A1|nr:hypothetical protein [Kineococcus indalonis]NAZ88439.1 hypothetical protein [Kineococcus indalonis]